MPGTVGIVWTVVILGLLFLCALVRMAERRTTRRVLSGFRPWCQTERVAALLLAAYATYLGGAKPGGGTRGEGAGGTPPATNGIATATIPTNSYLAGFVLTETRFGESFDLSVPAGAFTATNWLLRGAFDDAVRIPFPAPVWFGGASFSNALAFPSGAAVFSPPLVPDVVRTNLDGCGTTALAPFSAPLGLAPGQASVPGAFWSDATPSNSLRLTWLNALLNRDTNAPVSFQAELFPNGDFIYRYDLSALTAQSLDGVTVGAWNVGFGDWFAPTSPALSSVTWRRISPDDLADPDRDGDGVPTASELLIYRTDPDLPDTDGDGVPDGTEIAAGTAPLLRDTDGDGLVDGSDPDPLAATSPADADGDGIPDAYETYWFGGTNAVNTATVRDGTGFTLAAKIAAGINPTNAASSCTLQSTNVLASWKLWDGFAADRPTGVTNLVYERTFQAGRASGWQQFFLSSSPSAASPWELRDAVLEWGTDAGETGTVQSSPPRDSYRIPFENTGQESLTVRLRATGSFVRSPSPLYLLAYAPEISFGNCVTNTLADGRRIAVSTNRPDAALSLSIDHSRRPCIAPLSDEEGDTAALVAAATGNGLSYEGDSSSGVLRAERPGVYTFSGCSVRVPDGPAGGSPPPASPRNDGATEIVILSPSVSYGECAGISFNRLVYDRTNDAYRAESRYPLDTPCLQRGWRRDSDGGWDCGCVPRFSTGLGDGEVPDYLDCDFRFDANAASATIGVGGRTVWSGGARHVAGGGDVVSPDDECGDCQSGCAEGNCAALETPSLGSLKFRVPLGFPRRGQVSGFLYLDTDGPIDITPSAFRLLARGDASVTDTESGGTRRVVCTDARGRDLTVEATVSGVLVTIRTTLPQSLEHTWEITNVNGDSSRVRLRKVSRLGNTMEDWTFVCGYGSWTRFDNIARVSESLAASGDLGAPLGRDRTETRSRYSESGELIGSETSAYRVFGDGERAVLRETYRTETDARRFCRSSGSFDYWDDPQTQRHGKLRLSYGDGRPWAYHDYDEFGRETLRIEQRDGSGLPESFPSLAADGSFGAGDIGDAFVTVSSYVPPEGDGDFPDDFNRPRLVTRYAVRDGGATTVSREWFRYTRGLSSGLATVREERWMASSPDAARDDPGNAYSYTVSFDENAAGIPLMMRERMLESLDADGILTVSAYSLADDVLTCVTRRHLASHAFPTYEVTETDATRGNVLRRTTRLTDGGAAVADETSIYDDQDRLRSTAFLDGTSLTNAYSCCRLLWQSGRDGRRVLRSAQTGTDHLYHAFEDVWLTNLTGNAAIPAATNGFRVTRHFFDAFGRETNTVVGIACEPGEAVSPTSVLHSSSVTLRSSYPYGTQDYAVTTDGRGKETVTEVFRNYARTEQTETVFTNSARVLRTVTRSDHGGGTATRREWSGGATSPLPSWTEERRFAGYDAGGRRVEYAVTASSDHPAVTNSVSTYDLLGRLVSTAVPGANGGALVTSNLYDGATSRIVTATKTGSLPVNYAYDEFGERIGMIKGNRSVWNRTTYETVSQEVYRVVTTVRMTGSTTNSVQIQKTQLTGLSDACRRHTVTLTGNAAILAAAGTTGVPPVGGSVTDTLTTYDPNTGIEASVSRTDGQTPVVTRSLYGIPIEQTTLDNRCTMSYDAFARNVVNIYENVATGVTNRTEAIVYDLSGNAVCRAVDYGADGVAVATAEFDVLNRMVRRTDALGHETVMEYDVFDRPVFTGGDAYPVRTSYDTQGRKTGSSTTRDGGATWDETQWEFDPVSGVNTAKQYADGSRISYDYTDNGQKTRTTWARGAWKEHAYNVRNLVSGTTYSGTVTPLVVYTYADSDKLISATLSDGTSYAYAYDDALLCTNETATIAGDNFTVMRTYDAFQRNEETSVMVTNIRHVAKARLYDAENRVCGYALTNSIGRGLNVSLRYDGSHLTNMVYTLPNGNHFAVTLTRNASRKELVTLRDYSFGAQSVYWYSTDYDLIGRPTNATDSVSLMREWLYNNRSELAVATVGANNYGYAYDSIGNRLWSAANLATNTYAVNSQNQYATAAAPGTPQTTFIYDADGNMTRDGTYIYSYDAENRLRSVTARVMTNGALRVLNAYDHRNRRIRKTVQQLHISVAQPPALPFEIREWQTLETHTFVRDGNNIVLEKVEFADGTVRTFEYYWGPDKSGTELGAGGVGGLLAVSVDGVFYIPCYDHNGNIILYVSETGSIAAQYAYDPYGNIVDSNGNLADVFNFGFSTQYHDRETGMVGYKRRFYRPDLGRWLNRDPIEEEGGENLYAFCGNNPIYYSDTLGLLIVRPASGSPRDACTSDGWLSAIWASVVILPDLGQNEIKGTVFHVKHTVIQLFDCKTGKTIIDQHQTVQKRFKADAKGWDLESGIRAPIYVNMLEKRDIPKCVNGKIIVNSYWRHFENSRGMPPLGDPVDDTLSGSQDFAETHGKVTATTYGDEKYDETISMLIIVELSCSFPHYDVKASASGIETQHSERRLGRRDDEIGSTEYDGWY